MTTVARPRLGGVTAPGWAGRLRRIAAHEWTLAVLAAIALAVVLNRGALGDPAHTLPQDIWDPSLVAYLIAWDGHALLHDPANIWQLNTFYPSPYGLAYTDSLLGYAPFAVIGTGPEAAVLRYNVIYILAQALVFFGTYALVRQLGVGRLGAAVAAVAFGVAPWRLAQAGHLQILSAGGMALALAMLARGHGVRWRVDPERPERPPLRPGWALAGWLVGAWQLAIGFGIGLPFLYVALGCVVIGVMIWAVRRRPVPPWRLLVADGAGGLIFAGTAVLLAQPYLRVLQLYPYTRRDAAWVALYSPPLRGLFTAPAESVVWGDAHAGARARLTIPGEMALLPGYALYALAAAGLLFSVWSLAIRLALAAGAVAMFALGLGTHGPDGGHLGYLLLLNLPGFEGLRTPGRLIVWATLLLALLAAGAIGALVEMAVGAARQRDRRGPAVWLWAVLLLPMLLVLGEGLGRTPHVRVPPAPPTLSTVAAPYLVLPTDQVGDMHIMLWSTDRFADVVNGGSGVVPAEQDRTRRAVRNFPDAASVAYLRGIGVRTVVVVTARAAGTRWERAEDLPIDGLGITREIRPDAVVFHLP